MRKFFFALLTSLLFSGSYVAGKYTTVDLDPLTTTLFRYLIALFFLLGIAPFFGWRSLRLNPRDGLWILALGVFGVVGYHYFFFLSLRYTAVANTAIINALSPVFTGMAAGVLLHERLSARTYFGVILCVVGVLTLLSGGAFENPWQRAFNRGDLLMLCAVLCWVAYALVIKMLSVRYSSFTLTIYATAMGVLCLLLLVPQDGVSTQLPGLSRASQYSLLYMGILASGIGNLTYNVSVRIVGATLTSNVVYTVVPVFVAGLALFFFGQSVTLIMLASMVLIACGLRLSLASK